MNIQEVIFLATRDAREGNFETFYDIVNDYLKPIGSANAEHDEEGFGRFIEEGGFYRIFEMALKKGDIKFLEFIDKLPSHLWSTYIDPNADHIDFINAASVGGCLDCLKFLKRAGYFYRFNSRALLTALVQGHFHIFKRFIEQDYFIERSAYYYTFASTASDLLDNVDWDSLFKGNEEWWSDNIEKISDKPINAIVLRFELFKRGFCFSRVDNTE